MAVAIGAGAEMPGETARCWMLAFHPKGEKAWHGFQTVIPAKAGIHFRCRNKTLDGSPPARGRRCGSILRAFLPANRRQLADLGLNRQHRSNRKAEPLRHQRAAATGRNGRPISGVRALFRSGEARMQGPSSCMRPCTFMWRHHREQPAEVGADIQNMHLQQPVGVLG